ncbi:hypothetical protein Tco_0318769 [Tanacetum coccineum]
MMENPKLNNVWKLYTDWALSSDGSGAELMLISLEGKEYTYALHFGFKTTKQRTEIALDRCDSTKNGKLEKPGNFHKLSVNDTVMSSDSASSEPDSLEVALASPDYVLGLEEPDQAPPSPNYMPGPEYPEYLAPSDKEVPVEDQPYVVADSPVALSPGYVADSDPDEDSKDGPIDYPADGGDDDNITLRLIDN